MGTILETERLILRTWTYADADALFDICREAEVMLHIGDRQPYKTVEKAKEFLNWAIPYQKKNGFCRWAVVDKSSGKIIGNCGFARLDTEEVELGYLLAREEWGKGFGTEAARACLKYGFENIGFEKIIALTDLDHLTSQKILGKIGFTPRETAETDDGNDLVFEISNQEKIFR